MTRGDAVYYRDEKGAHFGHLMKAGYKWARVQVGFELKRVPLADVKPWPPERVESAPVKVKRGR
jgi:hypothetical protein